MTLSRNTPLHELKIQLWMRGRDERSQVAFYRTISGEEFAAIVGLVLEHDGDRPWEREAEREAVPS